MSLRTRPHPFTRAEHPVATEFGIVTAALVGVYLWRELVAELLPTVFGSPPVPGGLLVAGLVNGGVLLAGLAVLVGAYAALRGIDIGLRLPTAADLPVAALAMLTPVLLVALTKLAALATGVPYGSLTKTSVAADAPVLPVLSVAALGLVLGVPALVLVCQVLVQGSFTTVVDADAAVALTILMTGFVMVSSTGRLATVPDPGRLVGAVVLALSLAVALYASDRIDHDRLRYLGYVPVLVFGAIVVLSGVVAIESVAGGLYAATQLAVLGVAAYAYDRSGSILVPTLAYAGLLLANRIVVVVFEAGIRGW